MPGADGLGESLGLEMAPIELDMRKTVSTSIALLLQVLRIAVRAFCRFDSELSTAAFLTIEPFKPVRPAEPIALIK